jgi:hypothetical protein
MFCILANDEQIENVEGALSKVQKYSCIDKVIRGRTLDPMDDLDQVKLTTFLTVEKAEKT